MADKSEKNKLRLPPGLSPAEEGEWWQQHREYWDQFDESEWEVHEPGPEGTNVRLPYMRLPVELIDAIYKFALARDVSTLQLIQTWLEERLEAERKSDKRSRKPKH